MIKGQKKQITEEMDMVQKIKTSYGEIDIEVPRDRDGTFEP